MGGGTSLNNQITFLNPLTEGNEENEESPVVVFRLIRALLFPGVEVGRRVIIGANAVVNDNIPDDVTAVGIPVRIVEKQK